MQDLHLVSVPKSNRKAALKFVVLIGVVSFFADFTYEGARSVTGPFMAVLGANGTIVGIVAGLCLRTRATTVPHSPSSLYRP